MRERLWKSPGDAFWLGVDYRSWPLQSGEVLVESNARGSLSVLVEDVDGNDVTSQIVEGAPLIDAIGNSDPEKGPLVPPNVQVLLFLINGTAGAVYWITVSAPTSDAEMLTERFSLEVRSDYGS